MIVREWAQDAQSPMRTFGSAEVTDYARNRHRILHLESPRWWEASVGQGNPVATTLAKDSSVSRLAASETRGSDSRALETSRSDSRVTLVDR